MNSATCLLLNDNFSLSLLLLLIVVSYSKKYSTRSFEFFSNTPVEFGLKKNLKFKYSHLNPSTSKFRGILNTIHNKYS